MSIYDTCLDIERHFQRKTQITLPEDVPGFCSFASFYKKIVDDAKDGDNFLEIGSFLGRSTVIMAKYIKESGKNIRFWSVDPWITDFYDNITVKKTINKFLPFNRTDYMGIVMKAVVDLELQDYVKLIQATSNQALEGPLKDIKFDFIFIDGSHQYQDVLNDIQLSLPFLNEGGIMAGDDFKHGDVQKAVEEIFGNNYSLSDGYYWSSWIHKKQ